MQNLVGKMPELMRCNMLHGVQSMTTKTDKAHAEGCSGPNFLSSMQHNGGLLVHLHTSAMMRAHVIGNSLKIEGAHQWHKASVDREAGRQGGQQARRARVSHPIAAGPLAPAAAEQSSAWLDDQTGLGARLRRAVRHLGRARQVGLRMQLKQAEQGWAGGVRHPGTCAGSGRGCPGPETAAAREETQYSDLWHMHLMMSVMGTKPLLSLFSLLVMAAWNREWLALMGGALEQAWHRSNKSVDKLQHEWECLVCVLTPAGKEKGLVLS